MSAPLILRPHAKDLGGGFVVRRLLPAAARQGVGPFIFFDHFGPVTVCPEDNHDVRPHPHIGLATVTYLFEGVIEHRDNLGYVQRIEPGAVNWMTAGSGIVHSERRPQAQSHTTYVNHGLQLWLALPQSLEDVAPSFVHTPAAAIPQINHGAATVRVLAGEAFGVQSPVQTLSATLYLDVQLPAHAAWTLPRLAAEQAVYAVQGALTLDGAEVLSGTMAVVTAPSLLQAGDQPLRLVVIGGEPLGHRHMWWNFVSSSKECIETAKVAWTRGDAAQGMGQVPGETERIELPLR